FALQGPERDKVQLLIHADVGTDYPASKVVSVGYIITDRNGRMVDSKSADMRLLPTMTGVPSALQYTSGASLSPGEYPLKLATGPDAPALFNVDVPPHAVGDARVIFTRVMPTHALPPGKYILRAILSAGGKSIKTLSRGFEIAAPKVLLTSADGLGDTSADAELFLPIDDTTMTPSFHRDLAVQDATVSPFLERLAPSTRASFDRGLAFLAAGDYSKAEANFKRAID